MDFEKFIPTYTLLQLQALMRLSNLTESEK